ncbi:MAG: HNH endonuclease [Micromonosporaceae bacterium]|nr:HNH endonuclease [Micromonosporaceae bacterium]
MWAAAQADALHDRAVLSWDILPGDRCACGGRLSVRPGVVDVQVKLTTLAGLDEHPAVIPGLGVTLAPIARQIAVDPHTRPTWRWSIFDNTGDLLHHGLTRARPTSPESLSQNENCSPPPLRHAARNSEPPSGQPAPDPSLDQARHPSGLELLSHNGKPEPSDQSAPDHTADEIGGLSGPQFLSPTGKPGPDTGGEPAARPCTCARVEPGRRRGVVELQLTLATLHDLLTNPSRAPGWQPVLADIATQVEQDRRLNPPGKWEQTDPYGNLRHHGHTQRMPDATEEAFIRARDRSCRAPHCQIPASRCELDHRIEYAKGGPSHRGCVDLRCKRHHHLRDRHDIRITRTGPTVTWTVPSGRTFTVTTDKDLILTRDD